MDEEDAVVWDDRAEAGELQGDQGGRARGGRPLQESLIGAISGSQEGNVHVSDESDDEIVKLKIQGLDAG